MKPSLSSLCILFCVVHCLNGQPRGEVSELEPWHNEVNTISYKTLPNGNMLAFDVYEPDRAVSEPAPSHIFIHGGRLIPGTKLAKEHARSFLYRGVFERLAKEGFKGISISYREAEGPVTLEEAVINAKDALRYIQKHHETLGIDPSRIVLWGESMGGYLTLTAGLSEGSAFTGAPELSDYWPELKGALVWYPAVDISIYRSYSEENFLYIYGFGDEAPSEEVIETKIEQLHGLTYIDAMDPPLMIVVGQSEGNSNAQDVQAKAQSVGLKNHLLEIPHAAHAWRLRPGDDRRTPELPEVHQRTANYIMNCVGYTPEGVRPRPLVWDGAINTLPYKVSNGKVQYMDIYRSCEMDFESAYPTHVYIHGGSTGVNGVKEDAMGWPTIPVFEKMAEYGCIGVSIDYSMIPLRDPDPDVTLEDCVGDSIDSIRYLVANSSELGIDPDNMAVWGDSAGALLALITSMDGGQHFENEFALSHVSINPRCVVSWYAPYDDFDYVEAVLDIEISTLIGPGNENRIKARFRPQTYLRAESPPLLLMHGELDRLKMPYPFIERAEELGVSVNFIPVMGAGHIWCDADRNPVSFLGDIQNITADYMLQHLGKIDKVDLPDELPLEKSSE